MFLIFSEAWQSFCQTVQQTFPMCETVGSIMGQHCAKGRYLDPENFSKELVLNFNLISKRLKPLSVFNAAQKIFSDENKLALPNLLIFNMSKLEKIALSLVHMKHMFYEAWAA